MSDENTHKVNVRGFHNGPRWFAQEIPCPHCGHLNTVQIKAEWSGVRTRKVVACDLDGGGCDKPFVVNGDFRPTFVCTTHKIEGLE